VQVAVLWIVQNGYVSDVPVGGIKDFQAKLTEFLTTRKIGLLRKIETEKAVSSAVVADLKAAAEEFKQTWK
jgi:F-type H+-transporting ATPase subunit alpha